MERELTISLLRNALEREGNPFDLFIDEIMRWSEAPASSLSELKVNRSKKKKGDIFELFCYAYLRKKYPHVWLLRETPPEVLHLLRLQKQDLGIDIIVADEDGYFSAVQCKIRKPNSAFQMRSRVIEKDGVNKLSFYVKQELDWKTLSTFFALVSRTGPWRKHIVMTNAKSIRSVGKKTPKDLSICYGSFSSLIRMDFLEMIKILSPLQIEEPPSEERVSVEDLREKRLKYFSKE